VQVSALFFECLVQAAVLSRRCVQFADRDVAVDIFGAYVSKVVNVI